MRRKKDALDYLNLGKRLSDKRCANCSEYIPQLAALMKDAYCSRACHDEHKHIEYPSLTEMTDGVGE